MLVFHGAMIMVADGAKLSLYRNPGRNFAIDLELVEHSEKHVGHTAENGTDKAGRSFSSAGYGRSAYVMRPLYMSQLKDRLIAETDKDFIGSPVADVAMLLQNDNN